MENKEPQKIDQGQYPVLPLRDIVVFPGMVVPLFVGREKSINALNSVMDKYKKIILAAQKSHDVDDPKDNEIYQVGCLGEILQLLKLPDGTVKILQEPKNALLKQYAKLFEIEGAKLTFTKDSLSAIAKKALIRKTGARGLRSILEDILLETMFELPSQSNISEVVINKDVVDGKIKPLLTYSKKNNQASSTPINKESKIG